MRWCGDELVLDFLEPFCPSSVWRSRVWYSVPLGACLWQAVACMEEVLQQMEAQNAFWQVLDLWLKPVPFTMLYGTAERSTGHSSLLLHWLTRLGLMVDVTLYVWLQPDIWAEKLETIELKETVKCSHKIMVKSLFHFLNEWFSPSPSPQSKEWFCQMHFVSDYYLSYRFSSTK